MPSNLGDIIRAVEGLNETDKQSLFIHLKYAVGSDEPSLGSQSVPDTSDSTALLTDHSTLIRIAENARPADVRGMDVPPPGRSDFRSGSLRVVACRNFTLFLILHNGGAVTFSVLERALREWGLMNEAENHRPIKSSTLRGWLSKWHSEGRLTYLDGIKATYTLTVEQAEEATSGRGNFLLDGFNLDREYPPQHRQRNYTRRLSS